MTQAVLENLAQAMQTIDNEFKKCLRNGKWPDYCDFLPQHPKIAIDSKIEKFDEWQKYCSKRAVFPIELNFVELQQVKQTNDLLKQKLKSNLKLLKNQEGIEINKNEIKIVHWLEFLRNINTSSYMIDFQGFFNGRDAYQVYLSVYYE